MQRIGSLYQILSFFFLIEIFLHKSIECRKHDMSIEKHERMPRLSIALTDEHYAPCCGLFVRILLYIVSRSVACMVYAFAAEPNAE